MGIREQQAIGKRQQAIVKKQQATDNNRNKRPLPGVSSLLPIAHCLLPFLSRGNRQQQKQTSTAGRFFSVAYCLLPFLV
jgi:hypothetical protein